MVRTVIFKDQKTHKPIVGCCISKPKYDQISKLAKDRGISNSELLRNVILEYLESRGVQVK